MKIYKPKVLKNGAIGGYYKKNGKMVWRLLAGPKTVKGGTNSYTFDEVNERLTSNINFLNLAKILILIEKTIFSKKRNNKIKVLVNNSDKEILKNVLFKLYKKKSTGIIMKEINTPQKINNIIKKYELNENKQQIYIKKVNSIIKKYIKFLSIDFSKINQNINNKNKLFNFIIETFSMNDLKSNN